jgi:transcriptional regulator with XRE-family HTH domain
MTLKRQYEIGDIMKRDWLCNIRKSKLLTQQYVASNSFIDRSYYSHIESGKRNPSLTVAKNIASVLNFDPMIFFKDQQINNSPDNTNLNLDIYELLNSMESGNMLYLYNNFNSYTHYAVTFSLIGVWKNSSCFFIDIPTNFLEIKKNLEKFLSNNEIIKYIHHINKEEIINQTSQSFSSDTLSQLEGQTHIFIWCHVYKDPPNDWALKLIDQLNSKNLVVNNKKIIVVYSYDASLVSAHTHIELMRKIPYLMTDYEIVDSPLYHSNKNSTIYPSLFLQEET